MRGSPSPCPPILISSLQVVFRSRHLHIVLRAVTINATKLLLMGLFMLCVLFVFAIINWRFFGLLFQASNDSSTYCDTVLECLLTNLYFGCVSNSPYVIFILIMVREDVVRGVVRGEK